VGSELIQAFVELREADVLATVESMLAEGADPLAVLDQCKQAMDEIGERFACGEAFIPELVMAGEIMQAVSARIKPLLVASEQDGGTLGVVVLGTAKGDIHDIGKDIVATMLEIAGFKVVDLGVDVAPEKFVAAARENQAVMIGVSALLTQAFDSMKKTVAAVDEAGLRPGVKVMIGGAPVTAQVSDHVGADGWGKDAVAGVELAKQWAGGDR